MSAPAEFDWNGLAIPFRPGETLAAALLRAGADRAPRPDGQSEGQSEDRPEDRPAFAYFCGIGMCQSCLVVCDGRAVEACITLATAGAVVRSRHG